MERVRLEQRKLREILAEYVRSNQAQNPVASMFLGLLIEGWATERDHELRDQLLFDLVLQYSVSIKTLVDHDRLKNRFLRIAAHDLSGPLYAIRGLSDILLSEVSGPLNEEQDEYMKTINVASHSILTLVNELLDISLIESGRLSLQMKKHSLAELIRERIQVHRVFADEKGIVLEAHYADLPDIFFDRNKMTQVLDNLVGNAIKFSPHHSCIRICLDCESGMSRVRVSDEGPGIHDKDQSLVFKEYEKLNTKPTGGEKCTGLGLTIAKRIVEAHRGTIEVQNNLDAGATFTFMIPFGDEYE